MPTVITVTAQMPAKAAEFAPVMTVPTVSPVTTPAYGFNFSITSCQPLMSQSGLTGTQ
jgi:hypothetical protein